VSTVFESSGDTAIDQLIDERAYDEAVARLQQKVAEEPDATGHAMLALVHFQREEYGAAAEQYAIALTFSQDNPDLQLMAKIARENAVAELNVHVPEISYFDQDELLKPASVPDGALPTPPAPGPPPGILKQGQLFLGNILGLLASLVMELVTRLWGRLGGYHDEVWTNWYRRPLLLAVITLAYMREQLNSHNLKNTYPDRRPDTSARRQPFPHCGRYLEQSGQSQGRRGGHPFYPQRLQRGRCPGIG
jgi:hypothetical protein